MIVDVHGNTMHSQKTPGAGATRRRVVASFRDERLGGMLQDGLSAWRSLSSGHPLFLIQQDYLLMLSYWLYFTNNLIGGMIEKKTDIICGTGFDFTSEDEAVTQRLQRFWHKDRINNFTWMQDVYTSWLSVFGECCFTVFTRPDGAVRVGFVEPYNIDRTYTDPGNPFIVTGVRLKGTDVQQPVLTTVLDPTQPEEASFDSAAREQRATFTVNAAGGNALCFYWCVNPRIVPADNDNPSLRGTPDLLASFDSATDAEEVLFAMRRRADVASRILWDITLQGAGPQEIDDFLEETDLPDEYTLNAHNEKVTWNMVAPDLKASEHETQHRIVRNYAIGGKGPGMPPTWFGDGTDANRASAQELPFTTIKGLTRRQAKQGEIFRALMEYQLVQAGLPPDEFKMVFPTISERDLQKTTASLQSMTSSLSVAEDRQWVTTDEARQVFRGNVTDLGIDLGEYEPPAAVEEDRMTPDYERLEVHIHEDEDEENGEKNNTDTT